MDATKPTPPMETLLRWIGDRCGNGAKVLTRINDEIEWGADHCLETTALEAVARDLRLLSEAAIEAQQNPDAAVARLEAKIMGRGV